MRQTPQSKTDSALSKILKGRIPLFIGFGTLVLLVGGVGLWAGRAEIAGAIVAAGQIQVDQNRQVIQHPEGGVVGALNVRDGDDVDAGDVLLRFDDVQLRAELTIIEDQLAEVMARGARFEAERDGADSLTFPEELVRASESSQNVRSLMVGQELLFEARAVTREQQKQLLDEQITQTENQIMGTQAQLEALEVQQGLISSELEDTQELLQKGLTQRPRLAEIQRGAAGIDGQIGNTQANIAFLQGRIAEMELQKVSIDSGVREEAITNLRDLRAREAELRERQLATKDRLARLDVRTPVSGLIYGSTVFALQSVISPAEPIMYVIPQDRPLLVVAQVPSIHVDQVQVGQEASLRFSAFDQRFLPEVFGHVTFVSADVLIDERTGASYYRVELQANEGELEKLGDNVLLPGMPVEAYIKTSERTVLNYLTKPATDYFRRAFRED